MREKLIALIQAAVDGCDTYWAARIADHLIANGVVVREKGEWEECDWVKYDGHGECIHYPKAALCCSRCRNAFKKELLWKRDFCPNCGADMRKGENG